MSQEKAQLIAPLGVMAAEGITATGVITATSLDGNIVGSATSLVNGANVSVGVITATSFTGNLTGNIKRLADSAPDVDAGVTTATSFVGNLTGSVTDLTSAPAITVGMVTATTLEGPVTGNITGNVSGLAGGLGVNYNGGWTGAGTSQINAGVVTATTFYGDGSNLDGVSSGPVSQQAVTIDGASTSIDLSNGNLVYATQSSSTTVSFANSENGNVYIIRTKDDNTTARTITWPDSVKWEGGEAPTLIQDNPRTTDAQVFLLVTRDMGLTWYGKEVVKSEPQTFSLWTWGKNVYGQLGQNADTPAMLSSPTQVGTDTTWAKLSLGYARNDSMMTCTIKIDGTLWAWGRNDFGEMGLNNTTDYSSPMQVGTDTTWNRPYTASANNFFGTKTDGTLWAMGSNSYAAPLGQNNTTSYSSPTQIPGTWGTDEYSLGGYNYFVGCINAAGELYTWGNNTGGQLGQNNETRYSSPTQVGTDTTWSKMMTSASYSMGAIKTDGTAWAWGYNPGGQLGQNNRTNYSSPVQIPGTTWSMVTGGYEGRLGVKTDGTLWSWGNNDTGQLGQNNVLYYSSPIQLGSGTTWNRVTANGRYNYATKTDGTAWSWGYNRFGELGQNSTNNPDANGISSPTQIPGTSWGTLSHSYKGGIGLKIAG